MTNHLHFGRACDKNGKIVSLSIRICQSETAVNWEEYSCGKVFVRGRFNWSAADICCKMITKRGICMATLTAKELTAIEDQLGIEENLVKKYTMYAQQSQDAQLQQKCTEIANKHQDHMNTLLRHLN